jgi:hypothetical protein
MISSHWLLWAWLNWHRTSAVPSVTGDCEYTIGYTRAIFILTLNMGVLWSTIFDSATQFRTSKLDQVH